MDLGLTGVSALVVGGGGGMGGAVCRALAHEGAKVAVAGPGSASVGRVVSDILDAGGQAIGVELDLGDADSHRQAVEQVIERHGEVSVLINFSGGPPAVPVAGVDAHTWRAHFNSMVVGVIALTDLVLPAMRARGWGRVITGTSSGAVAPIPNLGISNALRVSLHGWSKTLAAEVGVDGVTVNVVVPGRIATARVAELDAAKAGREGVTAAAIADQSKRSIPLRRYGTPEEFAAAVAFLAGRPASYITGSVVRVDGGLIPAT